MSRKRSQAVTLMELIVVVVVIGVIAAIAIPRYTTAKERAISQEAIVNLKLISAAEKIYKMEETKYYPPVGTTDDIATINNALRLCLTESNWDYKITGGDTFVALAERQGSGGLLDCVYRITSSLDEPQAIDADKCP